MSPLIGPFFKLDVFGLFSTEPIQPILNKPIIYCATKTITLYLSSIRSLGYVCFLTNHVSRSRETEKVSFSLDMASVRRRCPLYVSTVARSENKTGT